MGKSQERLAELLGLTFQQVQKYEKGVNRIAAGRLFELAKAVGVPVSFCTKMSLWMVQTQQTRKASKSMDFLLPSDGAQLIEAFMTNKEHGVKWCIIALIQPLNDEENQSD